MRALSIMQPWADVILSGDKLVENRVWGSQSDRRFDVLIHTGKKLDDHGMEFCVAVLAKRNPPLIRTCVGASVHRLGCLVGVVTFTGCVRPESTRISDDQRVWAFGPWVYLLENPRSFATPIPWKGHQRWFDVPEHVVADALSTARPWSNPTKCSCTTNDALKCAVATKLPSILCACACHKLAAL